MFNVVEKFVSINGEGRRAGELAVFIRFAGCNLNCTYCDTAYAIPMDCDYEKQELSELVDYIEETGIRNVTLTGGEPLLQPARSWLPGSRSAFVEPHPRKSGGQPERDRKERRRPTPATVA